MIDRRGLILSTLNAMLPALQIPTSWGPIPVENYVHNRNELTEERRPGVILLDGDETGDPRVPVPVPGRSPSIMPRMMRMTPEIYVVMDDRKPQNIGITEDLALARSVIVKAILTHPTLLDAVTTNGQIIYEGCVTDFARNRTNEGQMGLLFEFVYPFIPGEILLG